MAKPGEQPPRADEQALVERLAEAAAAAYARAVDLSALEDEVIGVSLFEYWDGSDPSHWTPEAGLIKASKVATADGDVETLWNLYDPNDPEYVVGLEAEVDADLDALGSELLALVEEREAYDLVGAYFTALCSALHRRLGLPAATYAGDAAPVEARLRAQLSPAELAALAARGVMAPPAPGAAPRVRDGLELVLWVPLGGDERHAGVVRDGGAPRLMPDLGAYLTGQTLGARPVETTGDDTAAAAAGILPDGAVAARVQALDGAWHDAEVRDGLWLCALPHGDRGGAPPVEFLDGAGAVVAAVEADDGLATSTVEIGVDDETWTAYAVSADAGPEHDWAAEAAARDATALRTAKVPALWDEALGDDPQLGQHNGIDAADPATKIELHVEGGASVSVEDDDGMVGEAVEHWARNLLERHLQLSGFGGREAARRTLTALPQALRATIDGREETFLLLADHDCWVALWFATRPRLQIRVVGPGAPPARLDLTDRRGG